MQNLLKYLDENDSTASVSNHSVTRSDVSGEMASTISSTHGLGTEPSVLLATNPQALPSKRSDRVREKRNSAISVLRQLQRDLREAIQECDREDLNRLMQMQGTTMLTTQPPNTTTTRRYVAYPEVTAAHYPTASATTLAVPAASGGIASTTTRRVSADGSSPSSAPELRPSMTTERYGIDVVSPPRQNAIPRKKMGRE